jgi:transposase InsO family protein
VHSIVDDCSRLAYAEIHDDERAETVVAFTRRAFVFFEERGITIERLMTDNHFSYTKSQALAELLNRRAIFHLRIKPYTPRTNGKVERFHQTLMQEWAYALEYASSHARGKALPRWLEHYNERRSHSALGNRPPIARVRNVLGFDS